MDFSGKNVAVVGFGIEGRVTAEWLSAHGAEVTVLDSNESLAGTESYKTKLGKNYLEGIDQFDLVVRAPTVRPELLASAHSVTTATQLFFDKCSSQIIGVTGTKGKGTTSTLIAKLLEAQGVRTWLGGNIGTPMLSFLDDINDNDAVVLELSSFQLMDLDTSPAVAVCLMIVPDHLNWHTDMDEYIAAKANITKYQSSTDDFVHHPTNPNTLQIAQLCPARKTAYMQAPGAYIEDDFLYFRGERLISSGNVGLTGAHNLENICAALTCFDIFTTKNSIEIDVEKASETIRDFKGLPNRLEFVRTVNDVSYYNDSYSVNPSATSAAVAAFDSPVIAIVGGVDKGVRLTELTSNLTACKHVVLIGEIANKLESMFDDLEYSQYSHARGSIQDIVAEANSRTSAGDVVLLSPGTSSFDMFENYTDRGQKFRDAVQAL